MNIEENIKHINLTYGELSCLLNGLKAQYSNETISELFHKYRKVRSPHLTDEYYINLESQHWHFDIEHHEELCLVVHYWCTEDPYFIKIKYLLDSSELDEKIEDTLKRQEFDNKQRVRDAKRNYESLVKRYGDVDD